jgi:hypothetical protein
MYGEDIIYLMYVDLDGRPVERTRNKYPYSYEPYVLWKGDYKKTDHVVYSDRLMQWDYDKFNKCCMKVWNNEGQYFDNRKPNDIENFLSKYYDKEIKLTAIMEGCNVSNGYPYWIFFYDYDNHIEQ